MWLPTVFGQSTADQVVHNKMQNIHFMLGKWQGKGWIMKGPKQKKEFTQTENVVAKAGGIAFMVEGLGKALDNKGQIVHQAFAVISYNHQESRFEMNAFSKKHGQQITRLYQIGMKKMAWSFKDERGGTIRFSMDFSKANHWVEKGEYSPDGERWVQFFAMNLKRSID
ncbi:hypothetical protein BKI52_38320 [marine bacterium AO1-C]|nr:hypothetical protein BKI52_38320 [marine bacterium AO1-C]